MESSSFSTLENDDSKDGKEIISSLPRENSWYTFSNLYQYQGFWYFDFFLEGVMAAQENFKAKSTDILVASHPKTGTTWLKALTFAIATRSLYPVSTSPLLKKMPHDCLPFLEIELANDPSNRDMRTPLVGTQIPYNSLPKSILDCECKIVYIYRDPKDVFVSLWHFTVKIEKSRNENVEHLSLEEAFELFCKGISSFGPYWDHVLGYWKAKLEFPEKILFLKYEEMKKDPSSYVKKLAEFIGCPFSLEEEENGVVEKITMMCSFENLSNLEVNKGGKYQPNTAHSVNNNVFFRTARIGDWQKELTPEMAARLDSIVHHKLSGSGFTFMHK